MPSKESLPAKTSIIRSLRSFTTEFWILNILQMLEKLAYWSVLLQMSVYTSQKGIENGLSWEQSLKGVIFFVWAMVQNLTPFFLGSIPDKYGRKKLLIISLLIIIAAYILLGTQREFVPFIIGILLLGFGSGLFKPALQGAVAASLNNNNSSVGWGIYFMMLNFAVILAPPLSKYLKELSWDYIFWGSALIMLLNLIIGFTWKNSYQKYTLNIKLLETLKISLVNFAKPKVYLFILLMSGFAIIYMQFYETFQNFILDWSNTSELVKTLNLPDFMTRRTTEGLMISYEWLYNINSILITLFIVFISWMTGFINKIKAVIIGVSLSTLGIALSGTNMQGGFLIAGFIIYTFGEMITNPKFADYLSEMSGEEQKSMYLGYLNLSMAFGLGGGALLGGYLYGKLGEKSFLAVKYLTENNINLTDVTPDNSFHYLSEHLQLSHLQTTELLWNTYNPWMVWIPFIVIAVFSIAGLWLYYLKFAKKTGRNQLNSK